MMKNKQEPILNRDKQVTPMKGETSPEDARRKALVFATKEKEKFKKHKD